MINRRCPACEMDLSQQPLGTTRCPHCGSELDVLIDLREPAGSGVAPSVLVVDDEADVRRVLIEVLEGNGFRIAGEVSNGPDAVLVSQRTHPTYVFLDYLMPAITGAETARMIRGVSPHSVIVSFSAALDEKPDWADAFLAKTDVARAAELLRQLAADSRR